MMTSMTYLYVPQFSVSEFSERYVHLDWKNTNAVASIIYRFQLNS